MSISDPNFFSVRRPCHLEALQGWLLERPYNRSVEGLKDRNGKPLIGLLFDTEKRGLIVCRNAAMYEAARAVVLRYQIAERWAA